MASSGALFERLHPSKRYKRYKSVTARSRFTSRFQASCYAAAFCCNALPPERYKRYKSVTSGSRFSCGFQPCCNATAFCCNALLGKGAQKRFKQMFVTRFVTRPEAAWEAALRHSALQVFALLVTLLILNTITTLYRNKY
jgi:hypothetical protein